MENKKSLYQYLRDFQNIIDNTFNKSEWVSFEILNISSKSGHYYIEITDQDENGVKVKSQNAVIYKSKVQFTINKFEEITGLKLNKGMRILAKIKLSFNANYGLSFLIDDIDPAFTLGEMEIKINNIRKEIQLKGESFKNKQLLTPLHFTKVAVIAPQSAAGLADFNAEANYLANNNICKFDYFYATFEGDNTENSIKEAFKNLNEANKIENYDVAVIIRGGGSKASLHYLNELLIARYVCRFPIPVFSGIGHEVDKVLIDEFANRTFDTPSKVIEYISNTIFNNYLRSSENIKLIELTLQKTIENTLHRIKMNKSEINQKIDLNLKTKKQDVEMNMFNIHSFINNNLIDFKNRINNYSEFIGINLSNHTLNTLNTVGRLNEDINFSIENCLKNKKNEVFEIKKIIDIYHPRYTLERGFAILKQNGRLIKKISDINIKENLEIELKDGKKTLTLGEKNE